MYVIQLSYMLEILLLILIATIFIVLHSAIWWLMEAAIISNLAYSVFQVNYLQEFLNKKKSLRNKIRVMVAVNSLITLFWAFQDSQNWVIDYLYKGEGVSIAYVVFKAVGVDSL